MLAHLTLLSKVAKKTLMLYDYGVLDFYFMAFESIFFRKIIYFNIIFIFFNINFVLFDFIFYFLNQLSGAYCIDFIRKINKSSKNKYFDCPILLIDSLVFELTF